MPGMSETPSHASIKCSMYPTKTELRRSRTLRRPHRYGLILSETNWQQQGSIPIHSDLKVKSGPDQRVVRKEELGEEEL